mgnify:CR=1 FL=1|tara:strand:- start:100 stop:372 length:273 start_codon:yes stop_codon:yes gene_type:complete
MPARRRSASKAPAAAKATPPTPKLSLNDYKEDFKVRLEIHNYEINALIADIKTGWAFASPYVKQATNYTVKTFNQVRERLSEPVGVSTTD